MNKMSKWNPFGRSPELTEWSPFPRWNPAREMEQMMSRMNQIFSGWPEGEEPMTTSEWAPPVDIIEEEGEYLVKAELPEVKKEDLKVSVEDGALHITGERKSEKEEKGKKFHRIERSYGKFERAFTLPTDAEPDKVTSECKEGILKVHLPKNPTTKSKSIDVKVQ